MSFNRKHAANFLTLYPTQPHVVSWPYRSPKSAPLDPTKLRAVINPTYLDGDSDAGMNRLRVGRTYRLRVRPDWTVRVIGEGTKEELLERKDQGEDVLSLANGWNMIDVVGVNEPVFRVEA